MVLESNFHIQIKNSLLRPITFNIKKFDYLNKFFKYTKNKKDIKIQKEQCIELMNKSKQCIEEIKSYKDNKDNNVYINNIINKYFINNKYDSNFVLSNIYTLYDSMNFIVNNVDFNNNEIIYTSTW